MKPLKATLKFFKKKSVQLWSLIMVGVCVVGFGIMSFVMVQNTIRFAELEFTERVMLSQNTFRDNVVKFDFVPKLDYIDTITFANDSEELSSPRTLRNAMPGGSPDDMAAVFQSENTVLTNIMNRLNSGRRTNSFTQFFTGGEGNRARDGRVDPNHLGSYRFQEEISGGVWLSIVFLTPEFVVSRDFTASGNLPNQIQRFNPAYQRPRNEMGHQIAQTLERDTYLRQVVNAIHIPLGNVTNKFTEQTWYVSIGEASITNPTSISFAFTTYGNYYNLLRYVQGITDDDL